MKKLISIIVLTMAGTLMIAYNSLGQENKWTLEECVLYAIEHNIQVKQQELAADVQQNALKQSKYNLAPSLNGGAGHSYSFGRALDESTYEFTENQTVMSDYFSLNSSVTLFNGFMNRKSIEQNRYNLQASIQDVEKIKNDISLNIALAYLQILLNKELLEVARNQYDITMEQIDRTSKLVAAGSLARGSLLEIQAQAASEELQVVNSGNQLDLSILNLTQLLELDIVGDFDIIVPELQIPDETKLIEPVMTVYSEAIKIQPQIKGAEFQLESSEMGLDIAKGARSPRLSFNGSYNTRYSDIRDKFIGLDPVTNLPTYTEYKFMDQLKDNVNYGLSLSLSVPIFNGWQVNQAVSNARLDIKRSQYNLEYQKNMLYKDIQQAYADAKASLKKFHSSQRALVSMEESFRYTEQKFNVGLVNTIDYKTSKNQLTRTQSDLLQAKYEYIFKVKVLDFYRGKELSL
ncbi:MAG: TolC family protein [Bacteroidetes bacterium]|nr:TolC family protein [Bacteroidota bacterium]